MSTPRLSKTGIDYLTHTWPFYTGCRHTEQQCPCNSLCWARKSSKRSGDKLFTPTLHPERLLSPLSIKQPARIGVCFTGDLFGEWVDSEQKCNGVWQLEKISTGQQACVTAPPLHWLIKAVINACPQHTFVFLTKNPAGLLKWEPFPDNCWVGVSSTNGLHFAAMNERLREVKAKVKYISVEPLLEWDTNLQDTSFTWSKRVINWLVIGALTGSKAELVEFQKKYTALTLMPYKKKWSLQPPIEWVSEIVEAADKAGVKVFLKDNLEPLFFNANGFALASPFLLNREIETGTYILRQEYPQ